MTDLLVEIDLYFPATQPVPSEGELVKFDGFDPMEKASAKGAFGGKSSDEVFKLVREGKTYAYRSTNLESWTVLEPEALRYYLRAYLRSLILELNESNPDYDFISNLFFQLTEAIRMKNGVKLFSNDQCKLLLDIGQFVLQVIRNDSDGRFEIGGDHIVENIGQASAALGGHVAG